MENIENYVRKYRKELFQFFEFMEYRTDTKHIVFNNSLSQIL